MLAWLTAGCVAYGSLYARFVLLAPRCCLSNESAAIGNLRTLASAEEAFRAREGKYGTLQQLVAALLIDNEWTDGVIRDNYYFRLRVSGDGNQFEAEAAPGFRPPPWRRRWDHRFFYVDRSALLRENNSHPAGPWDPPLGGYRAP